jgi:Rad3-related DNA helicase
VYRRINPTESQTCLKKLLVEYNNLRLKQAMTQTILNHFPKNLTPRRSQEIVLKEIDKVFKEGKRIIILEAPVGSGKSAIALTMANAAGEDTGDKDNPGGAHIITPRKSLQEQYWNDFPDSLVLMKGRNAYPCIYDTSPRHYKPILAAIREGRVRQPHHGEQSCSNAPCKGDKPVFQECTEDKQCPYKLAIEIAQEAPIIIHNLHSFIYQVNFSEQFQKRAILIVDEAHEIEGTLREFIKKKMVIHKAITSDQVSSFKTIAELSAFLSKPEYVPEETERERLQKEQDASFVSGKEEYLRKVEALVLNEDTLNKGFSIEVTPHFLLNEQTSTTLEIVPHSLGNSAESLLFQYGQKVLLMSGTIYNKDSFCRNLGINPSEAHFVRIGSSFPKENRPIYAKKDYQVDTSHANWNDNFEEIIEKIRKVLVIFSDAKGLIHAPSYLAAENLARALKEPRLVTHTPSDFLSKLDEFFASKGNGVFLSPTCQQGVDFKGDRARFQIILRVPYQSTSSKFVEDKVKSDFPWYNYQALVTFGQQIGRVNRSDDDYGATFLLDERFNKFISKNKTVLPNWVKEAIQY